MVTRRVCGVSGACVRKRIQRKWCGAVRQRRERGTQHDCCVAGANSVTAERRCGECPPSSARCAEAKVRAVVSQRIIVESAGRCSSAVWRRGEERRGAGSANAKRREREVCAVTQCENRPAVTAVSRYQAEDVQDVRENSERENRTVPSVYSVT